MTELAADANDPYDLVIMDYRMPGMNGIEAARNIKQNTQLSRIPAVVMVTNYGGETIMQQADEAGLDGFLLKPVNPSVLFDAIMHAFGREAPRSSRSVQESASGVGALSRIQGARVLLVEDNEINQQVADEILDAAGLHVSLANNGQEAVEAVKEKDFDAVLMDVQMPVSALTISQKAKPSLILLDIMMPGIDGFEVCRRLKADPATEAIPVIFLTALDNTSDKVKGFGQGAVVSDAVNLAARLEGLTRVYGSSVTLSELTFSQLKDPNLYMHRFVDKVSVKGKKQPVSVYEVYDGDAQEVAVLKEETKAEFEAGLKLYYDGKFSEASVKFSQVLQQNPEDKAARIYLERCALYMVKGVPEDWTGVETLTKK